MVYTVCVASSGSPLGAFFSELETVLAWSIGAALDSWDGVDIGTIPASFQPVVYSVSILLLCHRPFEGTPCFSTPIAGLIDHGWYR